MTQERKMGLRRRVWWLCGLALLGGAAACRRAETPAPASVEEPEPGPEAGPESAAMALVAGGGAVVPGQPFSVGVELTVPAGWHTYWRNPGETGLAPAFAWRLPEGVRPLRVEYPVPQRFEEEGIVSFGYGETVRFLALFETDAALPAGELALGLDLTWMICRDLCLPVQSSAGVTFVVDPAAARFEEDTRTAAWRERLPRGTEGWTVRLRAQEGGLELRVIPAVSPRSPAYAVWSDLKLFPERSGGAVSAQAVRWAREGEAWVATLAPGLAPPAAGDPFEAVLASGKAGDWTGWRIEAAVEPSEAAGP